MAGWNPRDHDDQPDYEYIPPPYGGGYRATPPPFPNHLDDPDEETGGNPLMGLLRARFGLEINILKRIGIGLIVLAVVLLAVWKIRELFANPAVIVQWLGSPLGLILIAAGIGYAIWSGWKPWKHWKIATTLVAIFAIVFTLARVGVGDISIPGRDNSGSSQQTQQVNGITLYIKGNQCPISPELLEQLPAGELLVGNKGSGWITPDGVGVNITLKNGTLYRLASSKTWETAKGGILGRGDQEIKGVTSLSYECGQP